ncbi:DUF2267 domain-containing protein [Egibacter rhizosphaerae]|nr:DUF2267 domain-containing protein [Egibacter rhizosphaerae]
MQTEQFFDRVQNLLGFHDRIEVVNATRSTLRVLGQRLSGGEAEDLAGRLTAELGGYLRERAGGQPEPFGIEVFMQRVAGEQGLDVDEAVARERAEAVVQTLKETVGDDELEAAAAQLPDEYVKFFAEAGRN